MNILFICTGNTCRSPMAEYIFNKRVQDIKDKNIVAKSCGILAKGEKITENSVHVMNEIDIDIKGYKSKNWSEEIFDWADIILAMGRSHINFVKNHGYKNKVYMLREFAIGEEGEILDPYGMDLNQYRKCRDELIFLIDKILENNELNY
ncbi:MAG: low molecular weight protein arginine phosphatase [Tissierellia bacterium]|nr:low molecular weight protein arginine phosphatase [Tissierellia bacterium]